MSRPGDPDIAVRLLGGFEVVVDGEAIPSERWKLRKARSLIKLLSLAPNERMHREQLMDLLWADLDPADADNNLRQTLHTARRVLGERGAPAIQVRDGIVHLGPDPRVRTDVARFRDLAARARAQRTERAYRAALGAYGGDLLPDDRYEDWAAGPRDDLRAERLELVFGLVEILARDDRYDEALAALRPIVAEDPANEDAQVRLMRLHASAGHPEQAALAFDDLTRALRTDLGTDPQRSTRALLEDIRAGRTAAPPVRRARRRELPEPLTTFVGRAGDLSRAAALLEAGRLLTLTGPGGVGKTRLAIELARSRSTEDEDVAFVDLAAVADAAQVPDAIAAALGVREQGTRPLIDGIVARLRASRTLLVLDGCEAFPEASALIAEKLLRSAAELRVVATSRQSLRITGEAMLAVTPLELPGADDATEEASMAPAVQLFRERAAAVRPGVPSSGDTLRDIVRICRRLGGLPLAIELVAAQVRSLSPRDIAARLDETAILSLEGGPATPSRHRSLLQVAAWSYERLGEGERSLFRRASVFASGWTLDTALALARLELEIRGDVIAHLGRLVDASLVVVEAAADGDIRYRMLETLRAFGRDRLERDGERRAVERWHAQWALDLALAAASERDSAEVGPWLDRLEREHGELRAVLERSVADRDRTTGLRLAAALRLFWYLRGHPAEGRTWIERLLRDAEVDEALRADALMTAGLLARQQGDHREARARLTTAVEIDRRLGRDVELAEALQHLGVTAEQRDDHDLARRCFEEAVAIRRAHANEDGVADGLRALAMVELTSGDLRTARRLGEEALAIQRRIGNPRGIAVVLNTVGGITEREGRLDEARALYEEGLRINRGIRSASQLVWSLSNVASVALAQGDVPSARRAVGEGLEIVHRIGDRAGMASLLVDAALVATRTRGPLEALRFGVAASRLASEAGIPAREHRRRLEDAIAAVSASLAPAAAERARADAAGLALDAGRLEALRLLAADEGQITPD